MSDLSEWMNGLALGKYASLLEAEEIDLEVLPDLREARSAS